MLAAEAHHGDVREDRSVNLVLECAGEDEWCVVSLNGDGDGRALAAAVGAGDDPDLVAALSRWAKGTVRSRLPSGCGRRNSGRPDAAGR